MESIHFEDRTRRYQISVYNTMTQQKDVLYICSYCDLAGYIVLALKETSGKAFDVVCVDCLDC